MKPFMTNMRFSTFKTSDSLSPGGLLSEIPDSRLVRADFDPDGRRVLNGSAPEASKSDLTADERINQRFRTYFTLVGDRRA